MPDVELFFLFPRLSHFHRWSFTDPALHRLYGQQRLGVSDNQWRQFSDVSFPQLTVPVHKYAYYGYHQPFGLDRFDYAKDRVPHYTPHIDKDWALESTCLQQHLHFATLYITRTAPTHTAAGRVIRYRLPRLVRALLIDQLTCRAVSPLLKLVETTNSSFIYLQYSSSFKPRYSVYEPVLLSCVPHQSSSAALETARWQPRPADVELSTVAADYELSELYCQLRVQGGVTAPLDELLPLGRYSNRCESNVRHCLWLGQALRTALTIDERRDWAADEKELERCEVLLVKLEQCSVLGYSVMYQSHPPIVIGATCFDWLRQLVERRSLRLDGSLPFGYRSPPDMALFRKWLGDAPVCSTVAQRQLAVIKLEWMTYIRELVRRQRLAKELTATEVAQCNLGKAVELTIDRRIRNNRHRDMLLCFAEPIVLKQLITQQITAHN